MVARITIDSVNVFNERGRDHKKGFFKGIAKVQYMKPVGLKLIPIIEA